MNQPKRKITEFNFEEEGAHVALVDKAANEHTVLVMKSKHATEEEIQKAVEANVKVPLLELLTRYMWMDIDDAEAVAGMMGFTFEDLYGETFDGDGFKDMVEGNLAKVTINKSFDQNKLDEFKKNFDKFKQVLEKNSQSSAASQDEDVVKAEDKETKSKTLKDKEEESMTKDADIKKSEVEIELEKAQAQLKELQKAKEEADKIKQEKADLEKSFSEVNKTVEVLKAAEEKRKTAEYLEKAKQHNLVVTDDNPADDLAKALRVAEETEGCESLVKAFEAYRDMLNKEDFLEEIGKSKTDDQPTGSRLDVAIEKAQKEHSVNYMKALEIVQKENPDLFAEEYKA